MSNVSREIKRFIEENKEAELSYEEAMRKLGVKMLNAIEMSPQEAAWVLLRFPMCDTSRAVRYVNTHWPEERHRRTKTELDQLGIPENITGAVQPLSATKRG